MYNKLEREKLLKRFSPQQLQEMRESAALMGTHTEVCLCCINTGYGKCKFAGHTDREKVKLCKRYGKAYKEFIKWFKKYVY